MQANLSQSDTVRALLSNDYSETSNGKNGILLLFVGIILTPITMLGALWGYMRAYRRFHMLTMPPSLKHQTPQTRLAMVLFGVLIWAILIGTIFITYKFYADFLELSSNGVIIALGNFVISVGVMFWFSRWQIKMNNLYIQKDRHGGDEVGDVRDLQQYRTAGLYIGAGNLAYQENFHMCSVAGTRSGKGINLIMPALLDATPYEGSWVIIDPKGEMAYVTSRYQGEKGQRVLILDPWGKHPQGGATYNPLDLLQDSDDLSDDATMIAEMIVPTEVGNDPFFNERARSIITGLVMHIVLSEEEESKNLTTLWRWLRLPVAEWNLLIGRMSVSSNEVVSTTAHEILGLLKTSEKTYGSVISSCLKATDFLKSPALQRSLVSSNFNINTISDGKTTLYVIIPADKLKSHYQWLRLIVTTSLRAVVRNPNQRVTFLLDEFASLGHLAEVSEQGLSAYAGYNITLWCILQNLPQLQKLYKENWQNFMGNSVVKHFFGIGDNFTAKYLSESLGTSTVMTYEMENGGKVQTSARPVANIAEVIKASGKNIFLSVDKNPTALVPKYPYFENPVLTKRADKNPFYRPSPAIRDQFIAKKMRSMSKADFQAYMSSGAYDKDPERP